MTAPRPTSQLKELRITTPFNAMPPPGPLPKLPTEVRKCPRLIVRHD